MKKILRILFCFLTVYFTECMSGVVIQSGHFLKHKGVRGGGEGLRTVRVRSTRDCARLCLSTDGCNLYNLGPEDDWTRRMRCELVTRNSTAVDVSGAGADGWVMYVRKGG